MTCYIVRAKQCGKDELIIRCQQKSLVLSQSFHGWADLLEISAGKSLERNESVTGDVVLGSGLVDNGGCSQDQSQGIHKTSLYYLVLVPHIMGILS